MPFPDGKTEDTREMHLPFRSSLGAQILFFQAFESAFLYSRKFAGDGTRHALPTASLSSSCRKDDRMRRLGSLGAALLADKHQKEI